MAESWLKISIFFCLNSPPSDCLIASTASDQWIRLGAGGVD